MNKVIRMTEEIWNLPAGRWGLELGGSYCALGKIAMALEGTTNLDFYSKFDKLVGVEYACNRVSSINDQAVDRWVGLTQQQAHEIAIRTGIEMLLAAGCTLETDDTVSRELARIKSCVEVV